MPDRHLGMTLETQPALYLHEGANSPSWTTGKHQVDFVSVPRAQWTACFLCYEGILKWEGTEALHEALGLRAGCSGSAACTSVPSCCPPLGSCKTESACGRDGKPCPCFLPPFLGRWWNPAKASFLWQLCPESTQEENRHLESRLVPVWGLYLKLSTDVSPPTGPQQPRCECSAARAALASVPHPRLVAVLSLSTAFESPVLRGCPRGHEGQLAVTLMAVFDVMAQEATERRLRAGTARRRFCSPDTRSPLHFVQPALLAQCKWSSFWYPVISFHCTGNSLRNVHHLKQHTCFQKCRFEISELVMQLIVNLLLRNIHEFCLPDTALYKLKKTMSLGRIAVQLLLIAAALVTVFRLCFLYMYVAFACAFKSKIANWECKV